MARRKSRSPRRRYSKAFRDMQGLAAKAMRIAQRSGMPRRIKGAAAKAKASRVLKAAWRKVLGKSSSKRRRSTRRRR